MKKKPTVCLLVPRYGLIERGVENFTFEFFNHLKKDFTIVIFTQSNDKPYTKKIWCIPESNRFLQLIYRSNPSVAKFLDAYYVNPIGLEMLTFSLGAFPYLLFDTYDLLFPQNGIWGAILCRIVRFLKKTPFIYRSAGGKEPAIVRQNPNIYIATTPSLEKWIQQYKESVKTKCIPNGVDIKSFAKKTRKIRLSLKSPIILCVAALIPSKRIDLTIRAVGQVKKGSLLILGDGPLKGDLQKLGEKELGKKRFIIQHVSHKDIASYYHAVDIFTLASQDEPFGIVYIEAMAAQLPIVAPLDDSRKYIVGNAGVLCDVTNPKKYVKSLQEVLKKDYHVKIKRQVKKFDWEKIAKQYTLTIEELLEL